MKNETLTKIILNVNRNYLPIIIMLWWYLQCLVGPQIFIFCSDFEHFMLKSNFCTVKIL